MGATVISNSSRVFFPNLEGIRFMAFFFVYLYHGFGDVFNQLHIPINTFGAIAVALFFTLSGFLITYLILTEVNKTGKFGIGSFYMRRTLRIWPLYYATVIGVFIIYPYFKYFFNDVFVTSSTPWYFFTFLSNFDVISTQKFFNGNDYLATNVTWSVSVEEQFYIIWPLLFYLSPKQYYKYLIFLVIAVCYVFRWLHNNDNVVLNFHSLSVCGDLAIGGLMAYYCIYSQKFKLFFEQLNKKNQVIIYGVLLLILGIFNVFLSLSFFTASGRFIYIALFAFIIVNQSFCANPILPLSKFKFISFWGKYTYGLYLLHPIGIALARYCVCALGFSISSSYSLWFIGCLGLIFSFLFAYLSYTYLENYFLKLKKKYAIIETT